MFSAFANTMKVPELRARILFTLAVIIVVRLGAQLTSPGVNAAVLHEWFRNQVDNQQSGSVVALFNIFSGGALENCAIFSLGIMPYISASIMLQLLGAVIPSLAKLQREDGGRQKISQYTRYATVVLCIFQGYLLAKSFENPQGSLNFLPGITTTEQKMGLSLVDENVRGLGFEIITVISMLAGTMLLMWLGDQITERGIGNGISLIITIGIVARLPAALIQAWHTFVPSAGVQAKANPLVLVAMVAFFIIVIASIIAITQAQRKISVTYARRVVGRKEYRGGTQTLPLKLNYAGVMPIIFGQSLLIFPSTMINMLFPNSPTARNIASSLASGGAHYVLYALMIFFFSYFWVAMMFQPNQIAEDLKKNGGYIPGVRPGKPTAEFLDFTMSRLTFAGAIFLIAVAILPQAISQQLHVPYITAQFFGGTSLLIIVGVILDTMRQIETHLLQQHYDGFLRKGRIKGGSGFGATRNINQGEPAKQTTMVMLCVGAALLLIAGLAFMLNR